MFVLEKIREYAKDEGRIAVIYNDKTMTYAELEHRSNAFADYLLKNGKDKSPVVIYGHKELEFLPRSHCNPTLGILDSTSIVNHWNIDEELFCPSHINLFVVPQQKHPRSFVLAGQPA